MRKTDPTARYTDNHEWARNDGQLITLGITDFAQTAFKTLHRVDLPKVGTSFQKGEIYCLVESSKSVSEIGMPLSGNIIEINQAIIKQPSLVNEDCYGKGWLVKIIPADISEWEALMTADEYYNEIGIFFNKI